MTEKCQVAAPFGGELVKNFNKTPALRPEMKGLRPGARLSTYNVAPLVKKSNKMQLFSPRNMSLQLLFAPNAAKFLLSQAIDKAEVAAPLIVKNFNKIAWAGLNIAAPSSVQVAAHFAAPLVQVPVPPPFQTRRRRRVGSDAAPMEFVKYFNGIG